MIKINNTQYDDYQAKVTWKDFTVSNKNGKIRSGESPFITFCLKKNLFIEIEFTFSKEMFINTKENMKTNIKEYISDIAFQNGEGWRSLTSGKYDCHVTKINEKTFNLDFYVKESEINIFINVNIDLF